MNMLNGKWIFAGAIVLFFLGWFWWGNAKEEKFTVDVAPLKVHLMVPGKVEAISQEIRLSFDQPGIIQRIYVQEGNEVKTQEVIAELMHDDLAAKVAIAQSELEETKARRDRIVKGPRQEEIQEAEAVVKQCEAEWTYQQTKMQRKEKLSTAVSQEEVALAKFQFEQAAQKLAAAVARLAKLQAGSRPEEIHEAEATVKTMEGRLLAAQANLAKAFLKAPIDGKVLRVLARVGESVTTAGEPVPVAILADTQKLRIRAEVDESHIQDVQPGQKAWVSAEAFGGKKFPASVVRVLDVMGRKKNETDDPKAKMDTRVLETILDVEKNEALKLGLRVDVQILVADENNALLVPRSFLTYVQGAPAVRLRDGFKMFVTPVMLGVEQDSMVQIKSGLKRGDVIVRPKG